MADLKFSTSCCRDDCNALPKSSAGQSEAQYVVGSKFVQIADSFASICLAQQNQSNSVHFLLYLSPKTKAEDLRLRIKDFIFSDKFASAPGNAALSLEFGAMRLEYGMRFSQPLLFGCIPFSLD